MTIAWVSAVVWAASALGSPAAAGTEVPLRWTERAVAYGHLSLTFTIDRLVLGPHGWSATMAIRNWDIALFVDERFALIASTDPAGTGGVRALPVTRAKPPLPSVLGVRRSWRGTIAGRGSPPPRTYLRLRLGTFRAVIAPNLYIRYVTRHAYHLP